MVSAMFRALSKALSCRDRGNAFIFPVLCSSRHQERLARYLWHEEHNPFFSRGC
jgi:hypothetical protein